MVHSAQHFLDRLLGREAQNNEFYGHAALLADYCGLKIRPPIRGLLQHGWSLGPGFALVDGEGNWLDRRSRLHVWNPENAACCRESGYDDVRTIGAPLSYLPPASGGRVAERGSLLLFPSHSVDSEPFIEDGAKLFSRYLTEIEEVVSDFSSITVCLYYREYDDVRIRRLLEDRGMAVTTLGHRDETAGFVHRFRNLVLHHEYVSTNSYSTALFYSLYLGRKTFVHGRYFANRLTRGKTDWDTIHEIMTARYPQLLWENFNDTAHREIGEKELGAEFRRKPRELRSALGWNSHQLLQTLGRRVSDAIIGRLRRAGMQE
jgi:hypothetical protein